MENRQLSQGRNDNEHGNKFDQTFPSDKLLQIYYGSTFKVRFTVPDGIVFLHLPAIAYAIQCGAIPCSTYVCA